MKDVVIQIFKNEMLANLAQTKLETFGIKSVAQVLGGRNGSAPMFRTALWVLEKDVKKSKELLDIK